jgi:hypothetical protein
MLVKKLFKILSLLRLLRELRYTMRGRHHGHRPPMHHHHGDHWHPRSRDYSPLYGRRRKPKLSHLLSELLHSRRY